MTTFKALPRGAQLVLVAGPLLVMSLLFTWPQVEVDYGRAGVAKIPLDGWDAWGLLLALLVLAVVVLVVLVHRSDVELPDGVPWTTVILALGVAVLAVAAVKSLTDAGSTPASYVFVGLAALVAVGAYLDWAAARRADRPALARRRRGFSSAA
jgi:quinol-cytochrome oxidoreductase complex cytochrome b subunit